MYQYLKQKWHKSAIGAENNLNEVSPTNHKCWNQVIKYILIFCILCVQPSSCGSSKQIPKVSDFALSRSTRIGIMNNTSLNFTTAFEEEFLRKGFNVSPAELMLDKNYTDISITNQNSAVTGTIATYSAKYIPAAIIISIEHRGISSFTVKVIDLRDQRLLHARGYPYNSIRGVVLRFFTDITPFLID